MLFDVVDEGVDTFQHYFYHPLTACSVVTVPAKTCGSHSYLT